MEWDFYVGRYLTLTDAVSIDYGIAYYSYHGGDNSSAGNYPEVYTKFGMVNDYGNSELNFWYSWDYFGTGGGHAIAMVDINVRYIAPIYCSGKCTARWMLSPPPIEGSVT